MHARTTLATLLAAALLFVTCLLTYYSPSSPIATKSALHKRNKGTKRNVILLISDGFGPASNTMARDFGNAVHNAEYMRHQKGFDSLLLGASRTSSASSLVTDSAAGATAFSCGIKTVNKYIGVDAKGQACGTVLEAAFLQGYKTGLVATSSVTNATPASFSAHVIHRDMEDGIAKQQIGTTKKDRRVDLLY